VAIAGTRSADHQIACDRSRRIGDDPIAAIAKAAGSIRPDANVVARDDVAGTGAPYLNSEPFISADHVALGGRTSADLSIRGALHLYAGADIGESAVPTGVRSDQIALDECAVAHDDRSLMNVS